LIKFIGDFKDLKPMGFTFHKLYARNYKVYALHDLWIWVSRCVVRFKDFDGPIFDKIYHMIIHGTYPLYTEPSYLMDRILFDVGAPKMCILDKETGEITEHVKFLKRWKVAYPDLHAYGEFVYGSGRFRDLIIHPRHIDLLKTLHERGMIWLEGYDSRTIKFTGETDEN
jgi:hypothetical protein